MTPRRERLLAQGMAAAADGPERYWSDMSAGRAHRVAAYVQGRRLTIRRREWAVEADPAGDSAYNGASGADFVGPDPDAYEAGAELADILHELEDR